MLRLEKDEGNYDLSNEMTDNDGSNHNQQLMSDLLEEKKKLNELQQ